MPFTQTRLVNPTQLTTSASSALYTVATGYTAVIKQIVVTNTTGNARTFTIYIGTTAVASNAIFSGTSIAANDSVVINLSQVLNAGDSIFALADANSALNLTVSGVVNDGPLSPVASYITDGQITTPKIADSAITTAKIAAGAVVTADLANNAVTQSKLSTDVPLSGMRNLIINGDMRINQRGFTSGGGFTTLPYDRWRSEYSAISTVTTSTSTDSPFGTGLPFAGSILVTNANSATTFATASSWIEQRIEGNNCRGLGWGTSSARPVTISFWVKSSVTGTFGVSLIGGTIGGGERGYAATYTINSANTWEQKFITIPGDTSGTWVYTEETCVTLRFWLKTNSNNDGTANEWRNTSSASTSQTNFLATASATFRLTGVQMEIGSQATPFEQRQFGTELALCQRYYEKSYALTTAPGTNTGVGAFITSGVSNGSGNMYINIPYVVQKRAAPTVTFYRTDGTAGSWAYTRNGASGNGTMYSSGLAEHHIYAYCDIAAAWAGAFIEGHFVASIEL